jgi:hypothetical protein
MCIWSNDSKLTQICDDFRTICCPISINHNRDFRTTVHEEACVGVGWGGER